MWVSMVTAAGWGMRVVGGKSNFDGKLGAFVTHVVSGGPADENGIRKGKNPNTSNPHLWCPCLHHVHVLDLAVFMSQPSKPSTYVRV